MEIDGTPAAGFDPISPGHYGVRVHARGRDQNAGLEVTEPSEMYLVQLWPRTASEVADRGIRLLRKTGQSWSREEPVDPIIPTRTTLTSSTTTDRSKRSPRPTPKAQATLAQRRDLGGRPLTLSL